MAKSIRSKTKRANRSEFRQTHGKKYIEQQQAIVQSKLQECTDKGSMNSFERLSAMLDTDSAPAAGSSSPLPTEAPDAMDTSSGIGVKSADKVPVKAKAGGKKKHMIDIASGQHGAKLARKQVTKMKRRGTVKHGQVVKKGPMQKKKLRTSKKKNTCAF